MSLLRPITEADHEAVLALNERHVELLAPMDEDRLVELRGLADRAAVIEHDGRMAGFVLTFRSGTGYDSANYRWFSERYDDFYYLDRVVVHEDFRRQGLATAVYDELEAHARTLSPVFALEVNLHPPNEPSLAFHHHRGFLRVGELVSAGHVVELMVKPLR
ncbi:MAG TPA: GNAT family N-acetyltransferase [Marmoricola sp.]|nr:GNAT family N-acetyltransferase [Marmoricola sp.]